ncbi:MAG: protein kinase [Polyangiaceae bacterium]|nr:protein kinase [Polyangiaceae bacterium]
MLERRVLAGRYRLLSKLGEGGMGSVWRAEHVSLGTPAAVKIISSSIAANPEALARFRREAQAAASLRSTNVVQIFDYGIDGDTPYIAMELLGGESLADRLKRLGSLHPLQVAGVLAQAGRAIAHAHDHGIVHRDLKPDNIFLARDVDDEIVKVLDFGIAKFSGANELVDAPNTRTGTVMGTPYYMSPEQVAGKRTVDHRTDIWALAVIAYECLTGTRPFEAETMGGLALAICSEPLPIPSRVAPVPEGFDDWFCRAAARQVEERFQSVREAIDELRALSGGVPSGYARTVAASEPPAAHPALPPVEVVTGSASGAVPASSAPELGETAQPSTLTVAGKRRQSSLRGPGLVAVGFGLIAFGGVGAALLSGRQQRTIPSAQPEASAAAFADRAAATAPGRSATEPSAVSPPSSPPLDAVPPALPRAAIPSPTLAPTRPAGSRAPASPARPSPSTRGPSTANCDPPYRIDEDGERQFKPECF